MHLAKSMAHPQTAIQSPASAANHARRPTCQTPAPPTGKRSCSRTVCPTAPGEQASPTRGPAPATTCPRSPGHRSPSPAAFPTPSYLPIDGLATASERVLREEGSLALQYGGAQGYQGLRDWLADHWTKIDGVPLNHMNYTLTNGSAHALENVCNTFLREGEVVIVEGPELPGFDPGDPGDGREGGAMRGG